MAHFEVKIKLNTVTMLFIGNLVQLMSHAGGEEHWHKWSVTMLGLWVLCLVRELGEVSPPWGYRSHQKKQRQRIEDLSNACWVCVHSF